MKLVPIIKLTGRLTVSTKIKFTLLLFELFCMPIKSIMNKDKLKENVKNNFFKMFCIYLKDFERVININYKSIFL